MSIRGFGWLFVAELLLVGLILWAFDRIVYLQEFVSPGNRVPTIWLFMFGMILIALAAFCFWIKVPEFGIACVVFGLIAVAANIGLIFGWFWAILFLVVMAIQLVVMLVIDNSPARQNRRRQCQEQEEAAAADARRRELPWSDRPPAGI